MLIHPSHNLSKCQAILSNDGFNFIMNLIALHALTSNTITNIFIYYSVFSENSQGEQTENAPEGNPKRHWNSLNLNEFQCLFCLIKSPLIRTIVVSVTMYYFHPFRLAKSPIAKQNLSHRANVICDGSPSRIRSVRRISLGITTRPRSSILLTIPVAFMVASSNTVSICSVWLQSSCLQRKEKYSVPGKDTLCVASGRDRAMRGRALRLRGGFLLPRGLDETPPGHVK